MKDVKNIILSYNDKQKQTTISSIINQFWQIPQQHPYDKRPLLTIINEKGIAYNTQESVEHCINYYYQYWNSENDNNK